ncbi:MAG: GNAT family N-acetyltransferase [Flavisolibacter sp.]
MQKLNTARQITIRPIEENDNQALASVIRNTLKEFGANRPGTVYFDETTDQLFQVFEGKERSVYYVAEELSETERGRVLVGGAGIYPSPGLPDDTCELVKMYLLPSVRGIGLGRLLIQKCIDFAISAGYKNIYLETMPELKQALKTYEKFGFEYLDGPMGNTGHFGCDRWMIRNVVDGK